MRSPFREMFAAARQRHVTESTQFATVERVRKGSQISLISVISKIRIQAANDELLISSISPGHFQPGERRHRRERHCRARGVNSAAAISKAAATSPDTTKPASPSTQTRRTTPCTSEHPNAPLSRSCRNQAPDSAPQLQPRKD